MPAMGPPSMAYDGRGRAQYVGTAVPTATCADVVPLFIVVFLSAVASNTFGLVPAAWHHGLSDLATWMVTAALAAIGLSANLSHIRCAGPRPILLGAVLWATVGVASLALQLATGTI